MRYETYTDKQRRAMCWEDKKYINSQIAKIMEAIGKSDFEIKFMTGDLTVLCFDKRKVVGFIHILPEASFYEGMERKEKSSAMYVDYVAVAPLYQNKHIASNLYLLAVMELERQEAETLSAVLLDEYSRRAFEKTAKTRNLELTKSSVFCTETMELSK